MRSLLPLLALFCVASAGQDTTSDLTQIITLDYVYGFLIGEHSVYYGHNDRAKRDLGRTSTTRCEARCANLHKNAMKAFKESSESSEMEENQATDTVTAFGQLCDGLRPFVQCIEECPSVSPLILAGVEPIKFLCIDAFQEIIKAVSCIQNLRPALNIRCKPRCHRFQASLNKTLELAEQPFLSFFYSDSDMRDMISGACRYVHCSVHCAGPLLRSQCGDGSVQLVSDAIGKIAKAVLVYDRLTHDGRMVPQECAKLTRLNEQVKVIEDR